MAEYAVECADKIDGKPYVIRVEAATPQHAIEKAAAQHEVRRAHRMSFEAPAPPPITPVEREMLDALKAQTALLRSIDHRMMLSSRHDQSFSNVAVRAVIYFVIWSLLSVVVAALAWPILGAM